MKKIICILLAMALLLALAGCGEYNEGSTATRDTYIEMPPDIDPDAEGVSKVTLRLDGMNITESPAFYAMFMERDFYAQWSDGYTMIVSKFDDQGVALATGLDGDFTVTLSDVPGDYTYNVNGYVTNNDQREIVIDLYRLYESKESGSGWIYPEVKELGFQGVYTITINDPNERVKCRFTPVESGYYVIESWVSVAEDNINPTYDYYYGSPAYAYYGWTIEDGGAEGSYTKNFRDVRRIRDDEISNVFIFAVGATAKDNQYPVTIQVSVLKVAEYDDSASKTIMIPTEELRYALEGKGSYTNYWTRQPNGTNLLDDTKCKLWAAEDGGDGYYHIYDEELYAETNGWGPTLYAEITRSNIAGAALNTIEWQGQGNNMLTIGEMDHLYDYKQFIEGFESLATEHGGIFVGTNYCVDGCPCHPEKGIMACQEGCKKCHKDCTQVSPELWGTYGYANAVNSDGVYPVTQELKDFLQLYAESHNLFCDGTGDLELAGLASDQDSMWLWAVGYYTGDTGGACEMGEPLGNYWDTH